MVTGIIILNYNNSYDTINCVESIRKYNTADIKYILVDNGSTNGKCVDEIDEYLQKTFGKDEYIRVSDINKPDGRLPLMTYLVSNTNSGFAEGNNKGLRLAFADDDIDDVLILNNDILFVHDMVPVLREKLYSLNDCAIVSSVQYSKDMTRIDYNCARKNQSNWNLILYFLFLAQDFLHIRSRNRKHCSVIQQNPSVMDMPAFEVDLPGGSCMLLKKSLFREMNGMDSNTFLYFEENILFQRVRKMGLKNYIIPAAKCIHLGESTTKQSKNLFILRCFYDSAMYYLYNYAAMTIIQRMMLLVARCVFQIVFLHAKITNKKHK